MDSDTQCLLGIWPKRGHTLILIGEEVTQFGPITIDAKLNQHFRAFGENNINKKGSLFDWVPETWRLRWPVPNILSLKTSPEKTKGEATNNEIRTADYDL